jgi:hypothetical protein
MTVSGFPSLPKFASSRRSRARRFSLELNSAREKVGNEHFRECRLLVDHADDGRAFQSYDDAFGHRLGGRYPARLAGQASFTEKFVIPKKCDDGFLALERNDGDLDSAFFNIEHRVGGVALRENDFILAVGRDDPAVTDSCKKVLQVERPRTLGRHATNLSAQTNGR